MPSAGSPRVISPNYRRLTPVVEVESPQVLPESCLCSSSHPRYFQPMHFYITGNLPSDWSQASHRPVYVSTEVLTSFPMVEFLAYHLVVLVPRPSGKDPMTVNYITFIRLYLSQIRKFYP